jgi:hypothetical protein
MEISRISFVKMRPRFASVAAFLCLIVAHFECPDISCLAYKLSILMANLGLGKTFAEP